MTGEDVECAIGVRLIGRRRVDLQQEAHRLDVRATAADAADDLLAVKRMHRIEPDGQTADLAVHCGDVRTLLRHRPGDAEIDLGLERAVVIARLVILVLVILILVLLRRSAAPQPRRLDEVR